MNARPCSRGLRRSGGRSRPSLHLYMLVVASLARLRGQKGRSAAPTQQVPREPGKARFCGSAAVQAFAECRCSAREAMQPRPASRRHRRHRAAASLTHSTRSPPFLTLPRRLQEPWTSALDSSAPARWQRRWPAPSSHRVCAAPSRSSPPTCEQGWLAWLLRIVELHFGLLAAASRAAAAAQQCSSQRRGALLPVSSARQSTCSALRPFRSPQYAAREWGTLLLPAASPQRLVCIVFTIVWPVLAAGWGSARRCSALSTPSPWTAMQRWAGKARQAELSGGEAGSECAGWSAVPRPPPLW